jgi:hypothetical protein
LRTPLYSCDACPEMSPGDPDELKRWVILWRTITVQGLPMMMMYPFSRQIAEQEHAKHACSIECAQKLLGAFLGEVQSGAPSAPVDTPASPIIIADQQQMQEEIRRHMLGLDDDGDDEQEVRNE